MTSQPIASDSIDPDSMTLEPPGSIAIIGAGPLGIEAALYGRFLGYEVTVFEAAGIGGSFESRRDEPLTLLPDQALSSLAKGAIEAQLESDRPQALPTTFGQWIDDGLRAIGESDLLRGRIHTGTRLTRVRLMAVAVDDDQDDSPAESIPDDFQLEWESNDSSLSASQPLVYEAVIVATGAEPISFDFPGDEQEVDYWFRIGASSTGDLAADLQQGYQQIVRIYAQLVGREDLDLYRPRRG